MTTRTIDSAVLADLTADTGGLDAARLRIRLDRAVAAVAAYRRALVDLDAHTPGGTAAADHN